MTLRIEQDKLGKEFVLNGLELRTSDMLECIRWGASPDEMIQHSVATSSEAYVVSVREVENTSYGAEQRSAPKPCAVWGWGAPTLLSPVCDAWLLTFPEIAKHRVKFMRASRKAVAFLLSVYEAIDVCVDPEYEDSVNWLTWLGFKFHGVILTPVDYEFHVMRRTR